MTLIKRLCASVAAIGLVLSANQALAAAPTIGSITVKDGATTPAQQQVCAIANASTLMNCSVPMAWDYVNSGPIALAADATSHDLKIIDDTLAGLITGGVVPIGGANGSPILGYVGGLTLNTYTAPAVTASSAYAAGQEVGPLLIFTGAARSPGATGMVTGVTLNFQDAQTSAYDLILLNANPINTTLADKTTLSLNVNDTNKVIRVIHISDCTNMGTTSVCETDSLSTNYGTVSTTSLYGILVARATPTFSVSNDLNIQLRGTVN